MESARDLITRVGVDRGGSEQVSVVGRPPEPIATAAAAGRRDSVVVSCLPNDDDVDLQQSSSLSNTTDTISKRTAYTAFRVDFVVCASSKFQNLKVDLSNVYSYTLSVLSMPRLVIYLKSS